MNVDRAKDGSPKKKKKRLSVERIYQKKTQLEHILLRPDAYIGSVEPEQQNMWVLEETEDRVCIIQKQITIVPGFYKIFDEILVNAADNKQRDNGMNTIKIVIDQEKNFISIWNNGRGIPIEIHKEQNMYVPTLIFGHLLTSSNYDDTQKKVTGGRNGFGAKLCNIFSTKFNVETACKEYGKKFKQTWSKNMTKAGEPEMVDFSGKDYTKISYSPDLAKFHMTRLDDDIVALLKRRAYDIAGTSKGVTVYLNGDKIKIPNFKDYVELYMKGASKMAYDDDEDSTKQKIVHEVFHPRWEVCVTVSKSGFQQASFVNSIATTKGGTHVNYIVDQITESMIKAVQRKANKEMKVKPFQIRNHIWVFVNCLIENPTFDSQTKENMTLRAKAFGSTCEVHEKFIKLVQSCGVMDSIMSWVKFKSQEKMNQKCSANKKSKVKIPKLDDANDAGSKHSSGCTLILTEGDSAKTLAISGLGVIGRDRYGVFPLKGKLLNVRDAPAKQISENHEITSLLQIIGLNFKKKYASEEERKTLRYGKVMIMADQDQDGSHIKGLVINFIHTNWPHLLRSNFLEEFITPIVKVIKGKEKIPFFSLPAFEEWKADTPNHHTWKVKYYKGLGTSTSEEAKEYFKGMNRHRIGFSYEGPTCDQAIEMAFGKKHANLRKDWLTRGMEERKRRRELGMPEIYLYHEGTKDVSYTDFINKELILFSNADNERSIPSLVDGLKPGQRKVLFTCFKRNDKKEVKVAQLAGSVAELSAYHHGENALLGTIINLAQNFVGANNINLLQPIGAFGSRIHGGKDAASPRYIFTMLSPLTRLIFPIKDDVLLNYLTDDNQKIEPEWYCPIIPMILVNGADGIGTGYRSLIHCHCPRQIVRNLKLMIAGEQPEEMMPYFKNFKGTIEQTEAQKYNAIGEYRVLDEKTFEITELPIKSWTANYKEAVLDVLENGSQKVKAVVSGTRDYSTDKTVHFVVTMQSEEEMAKTEEEGIQKKFKLESILNNSNMVLHDRHGCLKKYESADEILREFFEVRLDKYKEQKTYYEGFLTAEAERLKSQARFILEKIEGIIVLEKKAKRDVVMKLVERGFPSDPVKAWKTEHREDQADDKSESASTVSGATGGPDFAYLFSMSLLSLTKEKVDELLSQRDAKIEELNRLIMKTPEDLWEEDLDTFLIELDRIEEEERQIAAESEATLGNPGAKRQKMAAKVKPKAAKAPAEAKKIKKVKSEKETKPPIKKEPVVEEKESDEPMSLSERLAKKAGKSSAGAIKPSFYDEKKKTSAASKDDDDDDDDDDDSPFTFNDDDLAAIDSDSDFESGSKPKKSARSQVKKKQSYIVELSDSENSEIEATKALIAKLTPTKPKPNKGRNLVDTEKPSSSHTDLLDVASDTSDKQAAKPKKGKAVKPKHAKSTKKPTKSASSQSEEDSQPKITKKRAPVKQTKPKGKALGKRRVAVSSDEDDESLTFSDIENEPTLPTTSTTTRTPRAARGKSKVCYRVSSDEEDEDENITDDDDDDDFEF